MKNAEMVEMGEMDCQVLLDHGDCQVLLDHRDHRVLNVNVLFQKVPDYPIYVPIPLQAIVAQQDAITKMRTNLLCSFSANIFL